jgi:hypothetical protein
MAGYPYRRIEHSLSNKGWKIESYTIRDDRTHRSEMLTLFIPPDYSHQNSFGLIKHETGPEIFGFSVPLTSGLKNVLNSLFSIFSSGHGYAASRADAHFKGNNWDFKAEDMPIDKIVEIENFLSKFR